MYVHDVYRYFINQPRKKTLWPTNTEYCST